MSVREKPSIRALALAAVLAASGGLVAVPLACLPDLAPIPATAPGNSGCGDGVIATLDDGGDAGESCDPGTSPTTAGCAACQITCEGTLDPRTGHCYFSPSRSPSHGTSYQDALNGCRGEGAHVVTFASAAEIALAAKVAGSDSYWVGLLINDEVGGAYQSTAPDEPGYAYPPAGAAVAGPCPGCFGVGASADGGLFPVADLSPPATSPDTHCVASRGGSWFQVPCRGTASRRVVCEREPAGVRAQACSSGLCLNVPATAGAKTYLVVVSSADPETAAQSCNSLSGGSLVVFGSREEREQVARELFLRNPDSEQEFWIGLSADGADGGAWRWEDGVAADPDASVPSAYPYPWGNAQPASPGAGSARAYLRVGATTAYDTELAVADTVPPDGGGTPRLFICQRPPAP